MTLGSTVCDGRYLVLDLLGKGGMSTVYRVHDTRLGVDRALKVLSPRLAASKTLRERFIIEAKTMARLQHPNVVAVQDIGDENGLLYIVMELLEGGTLTQWVALNGAMPPRLAVDTLLPVLDALETAHEAGVIHRDVKPENIFLTRRGGAKIGDFGIAFVADSAFVESNAPGLAGTWAYMPPEQRNGAQGKGDARADVYALASVIFFLVTGRVPLDLFASGDVPALLEPLQGPLAELVQRATRYDPGLRYETIWALREALTAVLPSLPSVPENTPPLVRTGPLPSKTAPGVAVRAEFLTPNPDFYKHPTLIAYDSIDDDRGLAASLRAMLAAEREVERSAPASPPSLTPAPMPPLPPTPTPTPTPAPLRTLPPPEPASPKAVAPVVPVQTPAAPPPERSARPVLRIGVAALLVLIAWYAGVRWSASREVAPTAPEAATTVRSVEAAPVEAAPAAIAPVEAAPVEAAPVEAAPVEATPPAEVEAAPPPSSARRASRPAARPAPKTSATAAPASTEETAPAATAPAATSATPRAATGAAKPSTSTSDLKNPFGG